MGFDVENFGFGLLAGWGSAYAIYRARHIMSRMVRSAGAGAKGAQRYATRSTDSRYINDLIQYAERVHLAGDVVKLSDVLVEPRFIPAPRILNGDDEDDARDVFDVVPRVHDHPYLHAPYAIDTLSIDELATGNRALALLGDPGSGRTTALLAIAMHSLSHVQFKPPVDRVQQKIDAEDARLSEKERATRVRERLEMQQRAKERLANEKGESFGGEDGDESLPLFMRLMPVYVHIADMPMSAGEFGAEVDPAEPLVRAAQYRLGRVAASSIPRDLYSRLNKGGVLLLVDGYDDLPEAERVPYVAWLQAFIAQYGQNFIIVSGPATGFGALTKAGLTPVFMRSWSDMDTNRAAERWADMWAQVGGKKGKRGNKPPEQGIVDRAKIGNRALSPLEVTLKLWANYADDVEAAGIEGWLRAYLARNLPGDQALGVVLPQMAQIAAVQLNDGMITRSRLEALSIGGAAPATPAEGDAADAKPKKGKKSEDGEDASEGTTAQGKLLGMLRRGGLLVRYKGDRYQFRHAGIAAYLGSLTLHNAGEGALLSAATKPSWQQAIGYAALHMPIDGVVQARMNSKPDLLYTDVLSVARWLAYAGPDVAWRANLLKYLGNLMTAPSQYPVLRERAAAALVSTRDKNILLIFRRAVRTANADVRRLSCLGMGAVGDPDAIKDLVPLLQDQEMDVQLSASMALSAIRTEESLDSLVVALTQGSEQVRQAVAVAFSAMPEEGYPILHEAINDQDMMIRRAAVFGLERIKTTWSLIDIYRAFLEDEQWYVRSAAQQAFQDMQFGREHDFTAPTPSADSLRWLREWAAHKGEALPTGDGAQQMLIRALQEGETEVRALAAAALGQLGAAVTIKPLYAALRDRQESVRATAHRALALLQMQMGSDLPAPA